jgi:hypothetical protein
MQAFGAFPKSGVPVSTPMVVKSFSGILINSDSPGEIFTFAADIGGESAVPTTNQVDPILYPIVATTIGVLFGCVPQGAGTDSDLTFTLYKNGVATALTCTIPAASPAGTTAVDNNPAHAVAFGDGDKLDVRVSGVAPMGGDVPYSGSVSSTP